MSRNRSHIDRILADKEDTADTSLRAHSLRRAMEQEVPTTLTPHEWEQWYAEHGVPTSHRKEEKASRPWWKRWFR